jgi:hypothetical protein
MKEIIKEKAKLLFTGEITLKKKELWLIGLVLFLSGIVYGLFKAPKTHGVTYTIGSNNGNNSGNCDEGWDDCDCEEESEDDSPCSCGC